MRSTTRLTSVLVFLLAACGIATTAVGTIGVCCKNVYSWAGVPGEACAGTETTVCDNYSVSDPNGRKAQEMRAAVCTVYTASQFARLPCDSAVPGGWVKLPGQGPGGYCCYAYLPDLDSYDLYFQVAHCAAESCGGPSEP